MPSGSSFQPTGPDCCFALDLWSERKSRSGRIEAEFFRKSSYCLHLFVSLDKSLHSMELFHKKENFFADLDNRFRVLFQISIQIIFMIKFSK